MSAQDHPKSSAKVEEKDIGQDTKESDASAERQEARPEATSASTTRKPTIGVEDEETKQEEEGEQKAASNVQPVPQHDWQAIYSPQHNAYYFYNAKTQETTWTNPIIPDDTAEASAAVPVDNFQSASAVPASTVDPNLDGIDPELAYLDPTLATGGPSGVPGAYSARFNARTGRFTAMDGRDPTHLSEYERMKRMSTVFFDMSAWEQEVAARKAQEAEDEAAGKRRKKKPTKADLERFKAQKEARKKTKYAWLRE